MIMMGFWSEYKVPMDFFTWMKYGLPMVPALGIIVAIYMLGLFGRKIKTKDLTPGLAAIKEETRKMGKMTYPEYVTFGMLLLILVLWIVGKGVLDPLGHRPLLFRRSHDGIIGKSIDDFV